MDKARGIGYPAASIRPQGNTPAKAPAGAAGRQVFPP